MKAAIFKGKGEVVVEERPKPTIKQPTDAIVRVALACVCGSDLWYYRGESPHAPGPIGHEFIGVVEDVGSKVTEVKTGDLVIAPFKYNDGTCPHCRAGWTANCVQGGSFGSHGADGGQGDYVRVPFANATLVTVPGKNHPDVVLKSLLTLSDVMCTGHHAAVSAGVKRGDTVAVVGDGAVGLCAIIAAKRLGAKRIIALSRYPTRQALAKAFGATDIVEERGEEANEKVLAMTDGVGVDAALECVGLDEAMQTAFAISRPGAIVGTVGIPHGIEVPIRTVIVRNIGLRGGVAPVRHYIPDLLPDVLDGSIDPGRVFDYETTLDNINEAYAAMDERRAIKSLLNVSDVRTRR